MSKFEYKLKMWFKEKLTRKWILPFATNKKKVDE